MATVANHYREHASVCLRLARSASETDRPLLLSMAQAWLELAESANKIEAAADLANDPKKPPRN